MSSDSKTRWEVIQPFGVERQRPIVMQCTTDGDNTSEEAKKRTEKRETTVAERESKRERKRGGT